MRSATSVWPSTTKRVGGSVASRVSAAVRLDMAGRCATPTGKMGSTRTNRQPQNQTAHGSAKSSESVILPGSVVNVNWIILITTRSRRVQPDGIKSAKSTRGYEGPRIGTICSSSELSFDQKSNQYATRASKCHRKAPKQARDCINQPDGIKSARSTRGYEGPRIGTICSSFQNSRSKTRCQPKL